MRQRINYDILRILFILFNPDIWEEKVVLDLLGAAFSRDLFNSRLQAAPTGVYFRNLDPINRRFPHSPAHSKS